MKKSNFLNRNYLLVVLLVLPIAISPDTSGLMATANGRQSPSPTKHDIPLVGGTFGVSAEYVKYRAKLFENKERPNILKMPSLDLSPLPPPETYGVPILETVEDYASVDDDVKRGVAAMSAWLQKEYDIWPVISSGRRSHKNNEKVNGSKISWHLVGRAVDLCVGNLTEEEKRKIKKRAHEMGWEEVIYHDAGDGLHLHLANIQ